MARRKVNNTNTTISISWADKELFRKYARYTKDTKTGKRSESDSVLFNRILTYYSEKFPLSPNTEPKSTYPVRSTSQEDDQQDSSS